MRQTIKILFIIFLILVLGVGALFMYRPKFERRVRGEAQQVLMDQILQGETEVLLTDIPVVQGVEQEFSDNAVPEEEETPPTGRKASIEVEGYAVIEIPSIDLAMPLVKGTDRHSLNVAAGWYTESAEIGSVGNAVILGHRMYGYGEHFNRLDEICVEDEIIITLANGSSYVYTVSGTEIIAPEELMNTLREHQDGYILTLVTCTPTGVGSHRLLVYATLAGTQDSRTDPTFTADSREGEDK